MEHPTKGTPELNKQQKLKQLNQQLDRLLLHKQISPQHLTSQAIQIKREEKLNNQETHQTKIPKTKKIKKQEHQKEQHSQKEQPHRKEETHTMRKGAGIVWQDKTMDDWPQNDYRIFCGNLGKEVSDEVLATVFRRYSSFQMARVVRDHRTGKARGYGFVSLGSPTDFLKALKEMNGVHVGNRPVKVMKSTWKDRELDSEKNQSLPSDFKKNSQKETHKICLDYKYVNPY